MLISCKICVGELMKKALLGPKKWPYFKSRRIGKILYSLDRLSFLGVIAHPLSLILQRLPLTPSPLCCSPKPFAQRSDPATLHLKIGEHLTGHLQVGFNE